MKKAIIFLTIILNFYFFPCAFSQEILWEKSYGGEHADYLFDVQPTADNGFILAGSSLSGLSGNKTQSAGGNLDYWLWKMDSRGDEEWQKSFGGSGIDMLNSIKNTWDGGFILGGTSNSSISKFKKENCRGGNDYWIIKLNAKGTEEWQKTYGGTGQDDLAAIVQTPDGGYIVGGSSGSDPLRNYRKNDSKNTCDKSEKSRGNLDYWIIKLDKDGNIEWQKTYGGLYSDILRSLIITSDGGYLVGGYSNSPQSGDKSNVNFGTGGDYWIIKLDKKGSIEWQQTLGGDKDDQLYTVIQTHDKGFIIGGNSSSGSSNIKSKSNKKGTDFWILKLDQDGNTIWQETYDFGTNDILTSISENIDHALLIGGYSKSDTGEKKEDGIDDFIAVKISEKGEILWNRTVGSEGEDILKKLITTRDGNILLAGTANPDKKYKVYPKENINDQPSLNIGNNENLAVLDNVQKMADDFINDGAQKVNDFVDKKVSSVTDKINDKINTKNDSRVKVGINGPTGDLLNLTKGGGNAFDSVGNMLSGMSGNKTDKPVSRDKKVNFGGKDFWVVKLGKKGLEKGTVSDIEASPNPTKQFVNIILNFEYSKGQIYVFDLNGRQLQNFEIENQTIPVDLGRYNQGIYLISVLTDNGEKTIKVIKD